jgi:Family of unknown function (DUF6455)
MGARAQVPATNIYRMMERLGIDAAGGVVDQFGLAFTCAVRTCAACEAVGACSAWLDGVERAVGAPPFCPNVSLLFELSCEYPRVSAATAGLALH